MGVPGRPEPAQEFRIDEDRPFDGTIVLALSGEADLHVAGELRDRLSLAVDDASAIVLDLTSVTFVDSMTLGILVGTTKQARANGGQLRLVVPGTEIRRIFEVTLLDQVFPLDATREDALAAIRSS